MAVKRYNGTSWDVVAGVGPQGAAATSSSIATWVKTASGGETSVSGNDDSSQPLSYTIGQELVFINGVLQKRNDDYVANTGNSITGLTALTAGDIVSVWTVNAFSVSNAISNTIVDAKGDILVGTGADTPGRLAVGTNGQVLTAASTTGTGLAWATPSSGALTVIVPTSTTNTGGSVSTSGGRVRATGVTSISLNGVFTSTYDNYIILVSELTVSSGSTGLAFRLRTSGTDSTTGYYGGMNYCFWSGTAGGEGYSNQSSINLAHVTAASNNNTNAGASIFMYAPNLAKLTNFTSAMIRGDASGHLAGFHNAATAYDGFTFSSGTSVDVTLVVYGIQKS